MARRGSPGRRRRRRSPPSRSGLLVEGGAPSVRVARAHTVTPRSARHATESATTVVRPLARHVGSIARPVDGSNRRSAFGAIATRSIEPVPGRSSGGSRTITFARPLSVSGARIPSASVPPRRRPAPPPSRGQGPRRREARRPRRRPRRPAPGAPARPGANPRAGCRPGPRRRAPARDRARRRRPTRVRAAPVPSQQVHRRRTDEPGHEHVRRVVVDVLRRADLLQDAIGEHGYPLPERDRLDLVVGHVDRRDADALVEPLELGPHLDAELGIEVRQAARRAGTPRVRARGRDPSPPAAAGRPRAGPGRRRSRSSSPSIRLDPGDAVPTSSRGCAPPPQAEPEVLLDRHVRIERVVLEHHRDVAVLGRYVVHDAVADRDRAVADPLEAGHHPQRGRFPAAGRPDQDQELAVGRPRA